ncbi:MAG TPA: hypothetical protein DCS73_13875 [Roseburia sp.]|nr:hypothetical protein [Roseburia sp.]
MRQYTNSEYRNPGTVEKRRCCNRQKNESYIYSYLSKVTIGTGVTKIGAKAFKSCKKLGTVKISSKKLKSVGKQAFKGTKTDIKVTVPAKKQTAYKKLLKNSGISRKSKIKK